MMGDILYVGSHVARCAPSIGAGYIEGRAEFVVPSGCRDLLLACVVPFEDAIGGNLLVQNGRQVGDFQVFVGSDEAATVASSFRLSGEGHHIASLQLKGTDAIVQLCFCQGIHVASGVFRAEVVARLAFVSLFGINSQGFEVAGIRHDDAAPIVELYLTIDVVDSGFTIYLHFGEPIADDCRGFYLSKNKDSMLDVDDIHHTAIRKWSRVRDLVIYVVCDGNRCGNSCYCGFPVGCHHA